MAVTSEHIRDLLGDDCPNKGSIIGYFEQLLLDNKKIQSTLDKNLKDHLDDLKRQKEQNILYVSQIKTNHHTEVKRLEDQIKALVTEKDGLKHTILGINNLINN